jgi:hypothetical protein
MRDQSHTETDRPERPTARAGGGALVLRVIVDEDPAVGPERAVRAGYLQCEEIADALGVSASEARAITDALERGIPYSDTPGEYERLYLIPAGAVGPRTAGQISASPR